MRAVLQIPTFFFFGAGKSTQDYFVQGLAEAPLGPVPSSRGPAHKCQQSRPRILRHSRAQSAASASILATERPGWAKLPLARSIRVWWPSLYKVRRLQGWQAAWLAVFGACRLWNVYSSTCTHSLTLQQVVSMPTPNAHNRLDGRQAASWPKLWIRASNGELGIGHEMQMFMGW